jgi:two-component system sensor histidine kinase TctE
VRLLLRPVQSLTGRLLWALVGSLAIVAVLLGATGGVFIARVAEQTGDRVLGASSRAIAETLAVEDGKITLDLPPSALGMLENDERDNVYYSVWHDDELLTGYQDLSRAPVTKVGADAESFRYDRYRGTRIRVAVETRRLPRIPGIVVVEVAETLDARNALARNMLIGLAALEALLVGIAGLLVWPALKWSLRPVTRLRKEMELQPVGDGHFIPLDIETVPAELQGLVTAFNALLQRLDDAVEGIRRFTSDASHQMRTPLAILRTHIAVLKRHTKPEGLEPLRDVEAATERLQHLLIRLVTLARADETAGSEQLKGPSDLRAIAAKAVADLEEEAVEYGVYVHVEASGACITATDPILTAEVLTNLLDNAIRYNRPGGAVTVVLNQTSDAALMSVEDDGPGIPSENREQVFQRFFRLSRDQKRPGSGLGLPIVRTLARTLKADLKMESGAGGGGLKVTLSFPAVS